MPLHQFEFVNNGNGFVPLLKRMLTFIEQQVKQPDTDIEQLLFKSKAVLTELLTNAVKHSGTAATFFTINADDRAVCFTKADAGKPYELMNHPELSAAHTKLQLSADAMHALYVTADENRNLDFTCAEIPLSHQPEIAAVAEHFGLLIITKIANRFYYQFDEAEGINKFIVEILLTKAD